MELNHHHHSVYSLTYHIIFVTKYRRPVLTEEMTDFLKGLVPHLMECYGGKLVEMETDKDHIHMLVELPPAMAPATAINSLKTQTSRELRARFDEDVKKYLWGEAFWSSSYFICTTGGATIDIIRQYIESQPTEEHQKRKYEKSGKYKKKRSHSSQTV